MFKPGQMVTYFPSTHPKTPRPAEFIESHKTRVRIKLFEPDGNTRTILTMHDCIGKVVEDKTSHLSVNCAGFKA